MLETPVSSSSIVTNYIYNLPIYRRGVATELRGVEIGLAHGFFLPGPFIKSGPLRNNNGVAEVAGCLSAAGLILILTVCLSIYGTVSFSDARQSFLFKRHSSRKSEVVLKSPLGWRNFTSGWLVGSVLGVTYCYICTKIFPAYS